MTAQAIGVLNGIAPVLLDQNGQRVPTEFVDTSAGGIDVKNQGDDLGTALSINFAGSGVVTSISGTAATVTIAGGGGGSTPTLTGQDTSAFGGGSSGTLAYNSASNVATPAIASGPTTAHVVGVYEGTAGTLVLAGPIFDAQFDSAGAATAGLPCWLSPTAAGKFTAVAPTTGGQVVAPLGTIVISALAGVTTTIVFAPGPIVQL
jgi:hypothetical protein